MEKINNIREISEVHNVQGQALSAAAVMALSPSKHSSSCLEKRINWGNFHSELLEEAFIINPSTVYDACDKIA